MTRSVTLDAVVLRSVDIGDADRFCILFSRERGRIAARAKGARKPMSRLAASLLPLRRAHVELHLGSGGNIVTSARQLDADPTDPSLPQFLVGQQAAELLLVLVQDDEPLPDIYDLLLQFLKPHACSKETLFLAFQLRLLSLLGLLPAHLDDERFAKLPPEAQTLVRACASAKDFDELCTLLQPVSRELLVFTRTVIDAQLSAPLRSTGMHL